MSPPLPASRSAQRSSTATRVPIRFNLSHSARSLLTDYSGDFLQGRPHTRIKLQTTASAIPTRIERVHPPPRSPSLRCQLLRHKHLFLRSSYLPSPIVAPQNYLGRAVKSLTGVMLPGAEVLEGATPSEAAFGLKKLAVCSTRVGKIYAIDMADGSIAW